MPSHARASHSGVACSASSGQTRMQRAVPFAPAPGDRRRRSRPPRRCRSRPPARRRPTSRSRTPRARCAGRARGAPSTAASARVRQLSSAARRQLEHRARMAPPHGDASPLRRQRFEREGARRLEHAIARLARSSPPRHRRAPATCRPARPGGRAPPIRQSSRRPRPAARRPARSCRRTRRGGGTRPARRRRAASGSTRACRAACGGARGASRAPPVSSRKRSSSRLRTPSTPSSGTRADAELDRERNAVEPAADLDHRGGVVVGQREAPIGRRARARRTATPRRTRSASLGRRGGGSASGPSRYTCSPRDVQRLLAGDEQVHASARVFEQRVRRARRRRRRGARSCRAPAAASSDDSARARPSACTASAAR